MTRAALVARRSLPPESRVHPLPGIGFGIVLPAGPFRVLDGALREAGSFPVPPSAPGEHSVSQDLSLLVVSDLDRVRCIDPEGGLAWELRHPPWGDLGEGGCCFVDRQGLVWATIRDDGGADRWLVLELSSGRVVGDARLECVMAGCSAIPHPDGRHVGLSIGMGQEGAQVYWARYAPGEGVVVVHAKEGDDILTDVDPSGGGFLTTSVSGDYLSVHPFPPGGPPVVREATDLTDTDFDTFDFRAAYIDGEHVIAGLAEDQRHLRLDARDLAYVNDIEYPLDLDEPSILPCDRQGAWATHDPEPGTLAVWALADQE
jgi:hypothetical protein